MFLVIDGLLYLLPSIRDWQMNSDTNTNMGAISDAMTKVFLDRIFKIKPERMELLHRLKASRRQ